MWRLYDQLIETIPSGLKISGVVQAKRWVFVSNEQAFGAAMLFDSEKKFYSEKYLGMELQEAAALIKSWDFQEASFGLAAINSYFNQEEKIKSRFPDNQCIYADAFCQLSNMQRKKKIGMIGHFPYVDRHPEQRENMYIFELEPRTGDYPASASEFLLPQMDMVYMTASTLVNKTIPRLLELSRRAQVTLVGSSCPLNSLFFDYGINTIAGTLYQESLSEVLRKKEELRIPLSKLGLPIMIQN